jgi:hypothetical protein
MSCDFLCPFSFYLTLFDSEQKWNNFFSNYPHFWSGCGCVEGMVTEEKRKKIKLFLVLSPWPGPDGQTTQAGTGDSVSRFRRYHCSTVINYDSYFLVGEQFCFQLLFTT